jgi:hypothetical protein
MGSVASPGLSRLMSFALPISREIVEIILHHPDSFRASLWCLRNDACAALLTIARAGIEQKCSPEHPFTAKEFVQLYVKKRQDCGEDPERVRADQFDKALALAEYLSRGLDIADALGISFLPSFEYWGPSDLGASNLSNLGSGGGHGGGGDAVKGNFGNGVHGDAGEAAPTISVRSAIQSFTQATRVQPTDEQRLLIEAASSASESAVIKTAALAGTGKTTACALLAESRLDSCQIYLAFNRTMVEHVRARLGHFMECRTSDSLAYTIVKPWEIWGSNRTERTYRPDWTGIASDLGLPMQFGGLKRGALARQIFQTVLNYCYSSDASPGTQHIPTANWLKGAETQVLKWTNDLWLRMISSDARIPVPPAQVMKWWQLSDAAIPYERVIFDEAQDANLVFLSILKRSSCQIFLVGDSNQQLYAWRGAVDAMARMQGPEFPLTRSWRSGQAICNFANNVLRSKAHTPINLIIGHPGVDSLIRVYDRPQSYPQWPLTILARTNVQVFAAAVDVAEHGHRLHLVGDIKELQWLLMDALRLFRGEPQAPTHWQLGPFSSWHALGVEVELTGDPELKRIMQIVEARHDVLEQQLQKLARYHQRDETRAPAILATTHRVKGREWDRVMLMDDFITPDRFGTVPADQRDAELNILYVAATRARRELYVPRALETYLMLP